MRQLTVNERRAGRMHGTIILLRRELKKDRRRHRLHCIKAGVKDAAILAAVAAPVVLAWVLIMDQLLKTKGL